MFSNAVSRSSARGNSILESSAFSEGVSAGASAVRKFLSRNSSRATGSGAPGSPPEPNGSGGACRFSSTDSGSAGVLKPSIPSVGIAGLNRNAIEISVPSDVYRNASPTDAIVLSAKKLNFILIRRKTAQSYRNRFRKRACTKGQAGKLTGSLFLSGDAKRWVTVLGWAASRRFFAVSLYRHNIGTAAGRIIDPDFNGLQGGEFGRKSLSDGDGSYPNRIGQHGQDCGASGPLLWRADRALPDPFRYWTRHHAAGTDSRLRHSQEGCRVSEPGSGKTIRGEGEADHTSGRRSHRGQARRAFPAARLANGKRHANQHERQRSNFEPGH